MKKRGICLCFIIFMNDLSESWQIANSELVRVDICHVQLI